MTQEENHGIIWLYQKRSFFKLFVRSKKFFDAESKVFSDSFSLFYCGKRKKAGFFFGDKI